MFNTHLEEFVQSINLDEDIFVVFDLNQNWFDSKGTLLRRVCEQNGVIFHNGRAIEKCVPFMLPFSDHSLVIAVCNFDTLSFSPQLPISRALNEAKVNSIAEIINSIDFSILNEVVDVNSRWLNFKRIIINIINSEAPLRRKRPRKHDPVP